MKKVLALFTITLPLLFGTLCLTPKYQSAKAEEPTTSQVVESSSNETPTSSYNDSEEVVINVDDEVSKISQQARDVIEVIKTIFNQKIVIGGISFTIGAIILWVLGKVVVNLFKVKKGKYENLENKLLTELGYKEQEINYLRQEKEKLEQVINLLAQNLKNEVVKAEIDKILNKGKEQAAKVEEEVKQEAQQVVEKVAEQVNASVPQETKQTIKELLDRK